MAETLDLVIHDLARGGAGVGKDTQGRIVFVPYTAPGDRVRVRITETHKNYAQSELIEVLEPSPERVQPPCPVFGRCGGCQWQHIPYALQWKTKVQGVAHALGRVQVALPAPLEELPAERIWEYRNRVQLRGFKDELGFMASGSNDRVPVDRCAIARPEINTVWEETRREGSSRDRPYKVENETRADGSVLKSWNAPHGALGFRQVHDEQNEKLKAWVAGALAPEARTDAHEPGPRALLDLYGGSGNLSLPLRGRMSRIDCVDTGAPRDASALPDYAFHRADGVSWVVKKAAESPRSSVRIYDAVIVDPPREGLGADLGAVAGAVESLGAQSWIAVGCAPDSWARDLSRLVKRGWVLQRAGVLDLFPQTAHVESLALLRRDPL